MSCSGVSNPSFGLISAADLKKLVADGQAPFILDVRHTWEYEEVRIEGSYLIPLPELENRLHELDCDTDIVVHCKAGGRSAKACTMLVEKGFTRVRNMTGGMDAYTQIV